jgi:hypothetical protein
MVILYPFFGFFASDLVYIAREFPNKIIQLKQTNHESKTAFKGEKNMNEKRTNQRNNATNKAKTKACGGKCKNNPNREEDCK